MKEAKARIKINKLLEHAGWRFFDDEQGKANILLESMSLSRQMLQEMGDDFEKTTKGFIDYLLLGSNGQPLLVLEAKRESTHPLAAKEQARGYALANRCRFVLLSNGDLHFLWDTYIGNPQPIHAFPTQQELEQGLAKFEPKPDALVNETIGEDYIALTKMPNYAVFPGYLNPHTRKAFLEANKLVFLRHYQLRALHRIQEEVKERKNRFLFEMATGTGKTLTAAAVIKLFLRTANARRVLFLVDRIELENQALEAFNKHLITDYTTVIFKDKTKDWRHANIVVSTVQTLLANNKYKREFSPTDFELVISDEAHRSIGGNSRAVFEYFIGYKLGLTATPKDYLKKIDANALNANDPRELERRLLLDTYTTFGCPGGEPTFRYGLIEGVNDGYLVNPLVIDARTGITTQLLHDEGYNVLVSVDEETGATETANYTHRDFEKKLFSEATNRALCKAFLDHALLDPISGEIGKSIVFCVSQNHAAKITQILNQMAQERFRGKYQSDFALQVTSSVQNAQKFTTDFTNNCLNGKGNFEQLYQTTKTRVCVTVGMMTTGYDCPDLLNICLMRPIFSPTDFVQMKGRGTRKHFFASKEILKDDNLAQQLNPDTLHKTHFKLFDFFANCEYFEEKFNYDQILALPAETANPATPPDDDGTLIDPPQPPYAGAYEHVGNDELHTYTVQEVSKEGMKIDRMYFNRFEQTLQSDKEIQRLMQQRKYEEVNFEAIEDYILTQLFDKPQEFFNLQKLRNDLKMDRRITLREMIEKSFGFIPYFKNLEQLLQEEFDKFDTRYKPDELYFTHAKAFFDCYLTDAEFKKIIDNRTYAHLNTHPNGYLARKLPMPLQNQIVNYIKDFVNPHKFTN